jgi:hypothetical protein
MIEDSTAIMNVVMSMGSVDVEITGDNDLIMFLLAKAVTSGEFDNEIIKALPEKLHIAFQDWGDEEEPAIYPTNTLLEGIENDNEE